MAKALGIPIRENVRREMRGSNPRGPINAKYQEAEMGETMTHEEYRKKYNIADGSPGDERFQYWRGLPHDESIQHWRRMIFDLPQDYPDRDVVIKHFQNQIRKMLDRVDAEAIDNLRYLRYRRQFYEKYIL